MSPFDIRKLFLIGLVLIADSVRADLVINEIHYDPLDGADEEFIEIKNTGTAAVSLAGYSLTNAVTYTFPAGTTIAAGGFVTVAENPTVLASKYAGSYLGPWTGGLSNSGEAIELRDAGNVVLDTVNYGVGFPWPTAANGLGASMELINTALDNDVSGSWRASNLAGSPAVTYLAAGASGWKYMKGTAEASTPVTAWRDVSFSDSSWFTGTTPIGYGTTVTCNTVLSDMVGNATYHTVFARKNFTITAGQVPDSLTLKTRVDDGCVVWINGVEVFRKNAVTGDPAYNAWATATVATAAWESTALTGTASYLVGGTNVVAIHTFNVNANSGDCNFDVEIAKPASGAAANPTPNATNSSALAINQVPPAIRQVTHTPTQPTANVPVTITAKITDTDAVSTVSLLYQIVDPGAYIRKSDAAYTTTWTTLSMYDDGTNGDVTAGDSIFTCVMPAALQVHRRLIRYKISANDLLSNNSTVPYADDEQPNFAYFTYTGVPSWTGAFTPGASTPQTFSAATISSIEPYHLIANATDVQNCQYVSSYNDLRFTGTMVYEGIVYDHIQFKNRGKASNYTAGKNKWNLFFNRARDFRAKDNWGNYYNETWNNMPLNANASPWAPVNRGSAGVEEASCIRAYELAGNLAYRSHYVHWRVIDDAVEASSTSQYDGDLWGLYLAIEPTEGNLLDERNLPDGNIYSIESSVGDKKHQGAGQATDSSDWTAFNTAVNSTGQTEAWYRANVDLPSLYTFLALNRLTGNVDVRPGDNYRFYHRSSDGKWVIMAYDLDMQYVAAHHWGGSMDGVVVAGAPNVIRAIMRHPALATEYRNRCRELLDLMASDAAVNGGQFAQLLDEYASMVHTPGQTDTWANLDAYLWNQNPKTSSAHKGMFFKANTTDSRGGLGGTVKTDSWIRTLDDPDADGVADFPARIQWYANFTTNTYPSTAPTWVRKATGNAGGGVDPSVDRQKGYGYKYLEWESLYGGYANANVDPWTSLADTAFPNTPTISYSGTAGYPSNDIRFTSSAFSDPQGSNTFAAMQWRIAEISAPGIPGYLAGEKRKYEVEEKWNSGELTTFTSEQQIPVVQAKPGSTYRVRVRHKDNTGRWSHWSSAVQFTVATPDVSVWKNNIVISEFMYNPASPTAAEIAAGGSTIKDDYEFIELHNISSTLTLDLTELRFTKGVDFNFSTGSITSLAPGAYVLIVKNLASFQARYGTALPVAGVWDATANLSNSGEDIKLSYGAGTQIQIINSSNGRYDTAPWVTSPDGTGPSLVLKQPSINPNEDLATNWRASVAVNGSPGFPDALASITYSDLTKYYTGAALSPSVATTPAGLSTAITYNGSSTVPTNAGIYQIHTNVLDDIYEGSSDATFTILMTDYNYWASNTFTSAQLADSNISGAAADPDGDGLVNLIDYAMNLSPFINDRGTLCQYQQVTVSGNTYPALTIKRRLHQPNLTYIVETSTDLTNWSTVSEVVGSATTNADDTETITLRTNLTITSQPRQFLRLRVEEN